MNTDEEIKEAVNKRTLHERDMDKHTLKFKEHNDLRNLTLRHREHRDLRHLNIDEGY